MLDIYVDGDACPVKAEVYRVALRYDLKVFLVSCGPLQLPRQGRVERVRVRQDAGSADDWIAEHVGEDDIAVTSDIPLARRCLEKGARVLEPGGTPFTSSSIGDALARRELMEELRAMGVVSGGPRPFAPKDRSRFLSSLDEAIQAIRRSVGPKKNGLGTDP